MGAKYSLNRDDSFLTIKRFRLVTNPRSFTWMIFGICHLGVYTSYIDSWNVAINFTNCIKGIEHAKISLLPDKLLHFEWWTPNLNHKIHLCPMNAFTLANELLINSSGNIFNVLFFFSPLPKKIGRFIEQEYVILHCTFTCFNSLGFVSIHLTIPITS